MAKKIVGKKAVDLTIPENFLHMRQDILRFADLDRNGHLNNVKFFEFCQESRVSLFRAVGAHDGENGRAWIIATLSIDFIAQAHWPGNIETGTLVLKFGNSSLQLGQGVFNDGRCVATAEMTMVRVDLESNKPQPIEPVLRERLKMLGGQG
ncbi:MAG: thioesterase family protein [Alphaproteobacteria bacterium]|nr:thioesterase family protein [Alphaproteobacteria bacterium]